MKFRVSEDENEAIRTAADREGMVVSAFIVTTLLAALKAESRPEGLVLRDVHEALRYTNRQLNGIGVNINQIARVANTTGEVPSEIGYLAAYCFRLVRKADAVISEVGDRLG